MHSIVLSCRATHNNELVQETHGNIVMDCNICTNLLDKLKHVVMPLSRKNPCNYIQDIQTRAEKKKQNFHKPPESCIYCIQNNSFFCSVIELAS